VTNSLAAHATCVFATPTDSMPSTRYVKGLTPRDKEKERSANLSGVRSRAWVAIYLYMNIQKRGKVVGEARTPQKMRLREKSRLARLPPVSASAMPAIIMLVKVLVNKRNCQTKRKNWNPRRWTSLVGTALL